MYKYYTYVIIYYYIPIIIIDWILFYVIKNKIIILFVKGQFKIILLCNKLIWCEISSYIKLYYYG